MARWIKVDGLKSMDEWMLLDVYLTPLPYCLSTDRQSMGIDGAMDLPAMVQSMDMADGSRWMNEA